MLNTPRLHCCGFSTTVKTTKHSLLDDGDGPISVAPLKTPSGNTDASGTISLLIDSKPIHYLFGNQVISGSHGILIETAHSSWMLLDTYAPMPLPVLAHGKSSCTFAEEKIPADGT